MISVELAWILRTMSGIVGLRHPINFGVEVLNFVQRDIQIGSVRRMQFATQATTPPSRRSTTTAAQSGFRVSGELSVPVPRILFDDVPRDRLYKVQRCTLGKGNILVSHPRSPCINVSLSFFSIFHLLN